MAEQLGEDTPPEWGITEVTLAPSARVQIPWVRM